MHELRAMLEWKGKKEMPGGVQKNLQEKKGCEGGVRSARPGLKKAPVITHRKKNNLS